MHRHCIYAQTYIQLCTLQTRLGDLPNRPNTLGLIPTVTQRREGNEKGRGLYLAQFCSTVHIRCNYTWIYTGHVQQGNLCVVTRSHENVVMWHHSTALVLMTELPTWSQPHITRLLCMLTHTVWESHQEERDTLFGSEAQKVPGILPYLVTRRHQL